MVQSRTTRRRTTSTSSSSSAAQELESRRSSGGISSPKGTKESIKTYSRRCVTSPHCCVHILITLKRDRCLAVAADHLDAGRSVCVDATNADLDVRAHWIKLAKRFGVPIRCVLFTAPTRLCEHNDTVRALGRSWITQSGEAGGISINPEDRTMLPRMAFHSFAKRYMAPTLGEGLQDVTKVDFVFSGDDTARKVWSRYWVSS